jgi:hypothetical protein
MKVLRLLLAFYICWQFVCCGTTADGRKTFAGLDATQGIALGAKVATSYVEVKQRQSGKNPVEVQPTPAAEVPWWMSVLNGVL